MPRVNNVIQQVSQLNTYEQGKVFEFLKQEFVKSNDYKVRGKRHEEKILYNFKYKYGKYNETTNFSKFVKERLSGFI